MRANFVGGRNARLKRAVPHERKIEAPESGNLNFFAPAGAKAIPSKFSHTYAEKEMHSLSTIVLLCARKVESVCVNVDKMWITHV